MGRRRSSVCAACIAGVVLTVGVLFPAGAFGAVDAGYMSAMSKLVWSDGAAGDAAGSAVAVSADYAVVGIPQDDWGSGMPDAGRVVVYTRSGNAWVEHQVLPSLGMMVPLALANDRFGSAVAISGSTIVVGVPRAAAGGQAEAGAVHVYSLSGTSWSKTATIEAVDPGPADWFGSSVAMMGDYIIVGSPMDDHAGGVDAGSVYVFVKSSSGWTQQSKLFGQAANDQFGLSVAVSYTSGGSQRVAVGAPYQDTAGANAGAAYTYVRSGNMWPLEKKITNQLLANDQGGISVALSGDTLAIGAHGDDARGSNAGAVHVFLAPFDPASFQQTLLASDGAASDSFGRTVAMSANGLIAGAPLDDTAAGADAGSAYVFNRTGTSWSEDRHLMPSGAAAGDDVGKSVALARETALVGASGDKTKGLGAGAAYLYMRPVVLNPVYRFYNPGAGTHFYTDSADERDMVLATWPGVFTLEGIVYFTNPANNSQPLYRFYNVRSRSHFYTASTVEKDAVIATWPDVFVYDGETYRVSVAPAANKIPVYRFYNMVNGSHFYTASADERDMVLATWPGVYQLDGEAFWLGQ